MLCRSTARLLCSMPLPCHASLFLCVSWPSYTVALTRFSSALPNFAITFHDFAFPWLNTSVPFPSKTSRCLCYPAPLSATQCLCCPVLDCSKLCPYFTAPCKSVASRVFSVPGDSSPLLYASLQFRCYLTLSYAVHCLCFSKPCFTIPLLCLSALRTSDTKHFQT